MDVDTEFLRILFTRRINIDKLLKLRQKKCVGRKRLVAHFFTDQKC